MQVSALAQNYVAWGKLFNLFKYHYTHGQKKKDLD